MSTIEIVVFCILLCVEISMIGMGIGILLPSPSILKIDKRKNCCVKGKKFVWQKKYRSETLCKLSEVKEAFKRRDSFGSHELCLKLKSDKNIVVFSKPSGNEGASDFDRQVKEINNFLCGNDEQCEITQERFYILLCSVCLIMGSILLYNTLSIALNTK